MNYCRLCGEVLRDQEEDFHRAADSRIHIPTWEACMRAATGDYERIIRVHHKITLDANHQSR